MAVQDTDLAGAVAGLSASVEALFAANLDAVSDDVLSDAVVGLERVRSRLDAAQARVVGRWDARRVWTLDRARSAAAWVAHHCRLPKVDAARRVRLARRLRHMPATAAALADGSITTSHAERLVRARRGREEAFERDEELLVDHAQSLSYADFHTAVSYWCQLADPDGAEKTAESVEAARELHVSATLDGAWVINGFADPIRGTIIHDVLTRIEQELFDHDWADAKARYGDDVTLDLLARTPAQRRLDALVEMAKRAAMAPKDGTAPRPLFTVLVDYPTLAGRVCELANGTPITPGQLVPWLTAADLERAVFDSPSRIIDLGRRSRLFRGAARRTLEIRDRHCTHPGCDAATETCEADHIHPWAHGGTTHPDNGRLRCPQHHPGRRQPPRAPPP